MGDYETDIFGNKYVPLPTKTNKRIRKNIEDWVIDREVEDAPWKD